MLPLKRIIQVYYDLLAAPSPEYLKSIKEAGAEYKTGKAKTHEEVFGK